MIHPNLFNSDAQEFIKYKRMKREEIESKLGNKNSKSRARELREKRRDMAEERINNDPFFYID